MKPETRMALLEHADAFDKERKLFIGTAVDGGALSKIELDDLSRRTQLVQRMFLRATLSLRRLAAWTPPQAKT